MSPETDGSGEKIEEAGERRTLHIACPGGNMMKDVLLYRFLPFSGGNLADSSHHLVEVEPADFPIVVIIYGQDPLVLLMNILLFLNGGNNFQGLFIGEKFHGLV